MGQKRVLAKLFAVVVIVCAGAVTEAQDMVFSASDVGEVATPPPPPSGPPSEALANALRLYQQEKYDQAAVQLQRVIQGETKDEPGNVQKAQFFLGKSFFQLKFYQAALGVFEEIAMMSSGHLYFQNALQWLAQLSRELPEPAGIVSLVGRYGDSVAVLQEFNKPETSQLYNELLYLLGRFWYKQGEFAKARDFFLEIKKESDFYTPAIFFVGITHVRERRAQPSAKSFMSIIDKYGDELFLADEEERFLSLAWLSLARIYYSTKHFESAIEAWDHVPQNSEYYLDALFETSWAFFQVDQFDRALGNIHTLNSPFFEKKFYPEAYVLKAVIYFGLCQYEDAQNSVNTFRSKYEPIKTQLEESLVKFEDNQAFFDFLVNLRASDGKRGKPGAKGKGQEGADMMGLPPAVLDVVSGDLDDRTLLRNLEYVRILEAEEQALGKMAPAFVNSATGVRIQQDINAAKSVAVDDTGNLARSRYERLVGEIAELINQATRVEIEILKALRGELDMELKTEQEMIGPVVKAKALKADAEHMLWPFDGEFWRDELGYYRQPVASSCGR
jgi:tetratricopeptide (TPR) repeat protein